MAKPLPQHDPPWWAEKRGPSIMQAIFTVMLIAGFGFLVAVMLGVAN
jgi:hypothetical protein